MCVEWAFNFAAYAVKPRLRMRLLRIARSCSCRLVLTVRKVRRTIVRRLCDVVSNMSIVRCRFEYVDCAMSTRIRGRGIVQRLKKRRRRRRKHAKAHAVTHHAREVSVLSYWVLEASSFTWRVLRSGCGCPAQFVFACTCFCLRD